MHYVGVGTDVSMSVCVAMCTQSKCSQPHNNGSKGPDTVLSTNLFQLPLRCRILLKQLIVTLLGLQGERERVAVTHWRDHHGVAMVCNRVEGQGRVGKQGEEG